MDRGESELIPAEGRLEEGTIEIHAEVSSLKPSALLAGVVQLADGRIVSSPLHPGARDSLREASVELAATQANELSTSIESKRTRVAELEQQIQDINAELRHKAGLDDVDKIAAEAMHLQTLTARLSQLRRRVKGETEP